MDTPVLTKNQQKRSLSGKKKPRDKCLRNVLVKPKTFTNPVADDAVAENVIASLERSIHLVEKQASPDNTVDESSHPKTKGRKESRPNVLKERGLRNYLCLGVNEVARAIENGRVISVLVEKDVDPQFMVSHIGTLCTVHSIPYLVILGLRNGTHRAFGFACVSLGVKAVADSEDNPFTLFHQCIIEAFRSFPFSKLPTKLPDVSIDTSPLAEEMESIDPIQEVPCDLKNISNDESVTALYKYRTSTKERVFIPKTTAVRTEEYISVGAETNIPLENTTPSQHLKGISMNFSSPISAGIKEQNSSENLSQSNDFRVEYKLHEVKRVRPNPDKKKRVKAKKIKAVK